MPVTHKLLHQQVPVTQWERLLKGKPLIQGEFRPNCGVLYPSCSFLVLSSGGSHLPHPLFGDQSFSQDDLEQVIYISM